MNLVKEKVLANWMWKVSTLCIIATKIKNKRDDDTEKERGGESFVVENLQISC